jgi:hypothetical protein
VAPAAEWELSGHGGHADMPTAGWYAPAPHALHAVWAPSVLYVPAGQLPHQLDAPSTK